MIETYELEIDLSHYIAFVYYGVLFYSYNLLGPLLTDPEPFDSTKQCKRGYNPYSYRKIRDTSKGDCYKGNC